MDHKTACEHYQRAADLRKDRYPEWWRIVERDDDGQWHEKPVNEIVIDGEWT